MDLKRPLSAQTAQLNSYMHSDPDWLMLTVFVVIWRKIQMGVDVGYNLVWTCFKNALSIKNLWMLVCPQRFRKGNSKSWEL